MKTTLLIAAFLTMAAVSSACAADAKELWEKDCAKCHGSDGRADTKMGQKLQVRDLTDPKVQASFTDAQAITSIKEGVKAEGKQRMPGFTEKLSEEEIKSLVAYVRTLKKG